MTSQPFLILAVSDATGELAYNLSVAASHQFEEINVKIERKRRVSSEKQVLKVIEEAKNRHGVVLFTMVSEDFRHFIHSEAKKAGVVAIDVMGPVLDTLSHYFHRLPSKEPGLQYRVARDYYKRTESIEYTVNHDEGQNLHNIHHADIVLLGISRTSKTPISMYLAYKGYRCANIPVLTDEPLPEVLRELDTKKMFGLTISLDKLQAMRSSRLKNLGRPDSELYAQEDHIQKEIEYSQKLFSEIGGLRVVDVTGKAIEEIAAEIVSLLEKKITI